MRVCNVFNVISNGETCDMSLADDGSRNFVPVLSTGMSVPILNASGCLDALVREVVMKLDAS